MKGVSRIGLISFCVLSCVFVGCSMEKKGHYRDQMVAPPYSEPQLDLERDDVLAHWNELALSLVASERMTPPEASRLFALVNVALFDALNQKENMYQSLYSYNEPPEGFYPEVSAAAAVAYILTAMEPEYDTMWHVELSQFVANANVQEDVQPSLSYGEHIGQRIFRERIRDGAVTYRYHAPSLEPEKWRPTPPYFQDGMAPQWAELTPFVLRSPQQFRPIPPPSIETETFLQERDAVAEIGEIDSQLRTPEQAEIAYFWADSKGTHTPPGAWVRIALQVLDEVDMSLLERSRVLAHVGLALADSAISCWDAKYYYAYWRPIDAINMDRGTEFGDDEYWYSLLENPNFPEYPSGHSTFSAAAATVLTYYIGDETQFTATTLGLPGVVRTFDSFWSAAEEAADSRIYGGIHFKSARDIGLAQGKNVAEYVLQTALQKK